MTEEQKLITTELYENHKKHCYENSSYGSTQYCQFVVFQNNTNKGRDTNITIVRVEIYDLTQDFIPKTRIIHNLIEPNGNIMFLEDRLSRSEIIDYLKVLTKIPMNE